MVYGEALRKETVKDSEEEWEGQKEKVEETNDYNGRSRRRRRPMIIMEKQEETNDYNERGRRRPMIIMGGAEGDQ